jgi:hypothetical protein
MERDMVYAALRQLRGELEAAEQHVVVVRAENLRLAQRVATLEPLLHEAVRLFGAPRFASIGSIDNMVTIIERRDLWGHWKRQVGVALRVAAPPGSASQ